MKKALYKMLQSSLLYYKKFWKDLEEQGCKINPYDLCVANRTIEGTQHMNTWHMLQSSLLYYKKFWKDLEEQGFKINPYHLCVANRTIKGT
jgi:hypothetical protein